MPILLLLALPTLTRADAPTPPKAEQAVAAASFLDSFGLNPSFPPDAGPRYGAVKARILALGIRHVRAGLDSPHLADLAHSGIKAMVVVGMPYGPNNPATGQPIGPPYNGTQADVDKIRDTIKRINAAPGGPAIDSVETSNEPDGFWNTWYNQTYGGEGYPNGSNHFARDLYTTLKADPATRGLTVIGTAIGKTPPPGQNPQGNKGELAAFVDWGNAHPYPNKGGTFSYGTSYDTIAAPKDRSGRGGYEWDGNAPSSNFDVVPYVSNTLALPFLPKPMACTETGYFTGTAGGSVTQTVLAKYVPRLFCEYFRQGVRRTFWYDFVDDSGDTSNPDGNRGLLRSDLTPKPAYAALLSLTSLLADPQAALKKWKPATLAYGLVVSPVHGYVEPNSGVVSDYDRVQYAHHLLVQKSSGTFCLLLWHDVADSAWKDKDGKTLTAPREIVPPALPAVVTLPAGIKHATLFSYDDAWKLAPRSLPISPSHQVTLAISDTVTVLALTP